MPVLKDVTKLYKSSSCSTFIDVLKTSTRFDATEDRDHIYAFLGMFIPLELKCML